MADRSSIDASGTGDATVALYWLPLGASDTTNCVRFNGRLFEALVASHQRRQRRELYHSALEICLGTERFVIEMTPVWGNADPCRGVVAEGAVGLPILRRSRFFRYEIRRWRNGMIPDIDYAVASPVHVPTDSARAQALLELVPDFPTVTWGRDELGAADMWNSNSLIAWLLSCSGHNTAIIEPPAGGRAPGWRAGLVVAARKPRDMVNMNHSTTRSASTGQWSLGSRPRRRS